MINTTCVPAKVHRSRLSRSKPQGTTPVAAQNAEYLPFALPVRSKYLLTMLCALLESSPICTKIPEAEWGHQPWSIGQ